MESNTFKKFTRSISNRRIAGVCAGLGRYFNMDPILIRVLFVCLFLFGGSGLLLYLIFWIITPEA